MSDNAGSDGQVAIFHQKERGAMTKQITMDLEPNGDIYLNKTSSASRILLDIIKDYEDGEIKKPEHQRDMVWTQEQKQGWVDRLFPLLSL